MAFSICERARGAAIRFALGWAFIFAGMAAGIAGAADFNLQALHDRLGVIGDTYDAADRTLGEAALRDRDLTELRDRINPLRAEIRKQIETLEPRLADTQKRLKEVGPAPAADAPAEEDSRIVTERTALTALVSSTEGTLKQARLLAVHGDQLVERIEADRRTRFAERLLTRSASIADPAFWVAAARSFRTEAGSFAALLSDWQSYADFSAGRATLMLAIAVILALIAAIVIARLVVLRQLERRTRKYDAAKGEAQNPFLALARAAIDAATPPLTAFAILEVLLAFDLLLPRLDQITLSLLISIAFFSIGVAVTRNMLSSARALSAFDEKPAAMLYHAIGGAIAMVAIASILYAFHRLLGAPSDVRNATGALMALGVGLFTIRAISIRATEGARQAAGGALNLFRFAGWIAVAVIFTALLTGYLSLAGFAAARVADTAITIGVVVLLLSLIDAVFATGYAEEGTQRRKVAAMLGINPARLDFFATILSGLLRALVFVMASFVLIGGWRTSVTDIRSKLDGFDLAFRVGQSKIALGNIILAIAALVIGLIVTRIIHRWLTRTVLPRASLDAGLQNSIATMFVYVGFIVAVLLSLNQLGINLQNIALVAGALSVGIGFGLQSIVSNFVSGIILLAERPIRVGDIIVVKGEEGYVRRISVRSTEIETFDRANVIVPNSDLITGMVKNWTHGNTTGRAALKIGVCYGSDPERVREILLDAVAQHPQVMKTPEPRVLLLGVSATALEFELRCIITNIDFVATVRSDLYFAILRGFRAAGIEVPPKV